MSENHPTSAVGVSPERIAEINERLQAFTAKLERVEHALDAAWVDIREWVQLARRQRAEHPNPNYAAAIPSEAGIEKSLRVCEQLGAASSGLREALASVSPPIEEPPCPNCGCEERDHRDLLTCRCPAARRGAALAGEAMKW